MSAPVKKRRRWPWIVGGIVAVIIVIAVAANGGKTTQQPGGVPAGNDAGNAQQQPAPAAANHTVIYRVTGTGKASTITYTTDGMTTTNQESNVKLPWSKTLSLPSNQPMQIAQVMAQGSGSGTIDVAIEVDGKVVKQAHADGYGVASANGNIGTLGG